MNLSPTANCESAGEFLFNVPAWQKRGLVSSRGTLACSTTLPIEVYEILVHLLQPFVLKEACWKYLPTELLFPEKNPKRSLYRFCCFFPDGIPNEVAVNPRGDVDSTKDLSSLKASKLPSLTAKEKKLPKLKHDLDKRVLIQKDSKEANILASAAARATVPQTVVNGEVIDWIIQLWLNKKLCVRTC